MANQAKLIAIFKQCLKRPNSDGDGGGEILVAAKSVYFGVGGGLQEFRRRLEEEGGFAVATAAKSEAGVSRHILEAVHR